MVDRSGVVGNAIFPLPSPEVHFMCYNRPHGPAISAGGFGGVLSHQARQMRITKDQFKRALSAKGVLKNKSVELLNMLYGAPNCEATAGQLARMLGYVDFRPVNALLPTPNLSFEGTAHDLPRVCHRRLLLVLRMTRRSNGPCTVRAKRRVR